MSSAIASARKRRAPNEQPPSRPGFDPRQQANTNTNNAQVGATGAQQGGLTLPQVIALVDKRLIALETAAKTAATESALTESAADVPENLTAILEEYNNRHEILGNEIQSIAEQLESLKTTVLQLQSYTMEVNKKLVDNLLLATTESTGVEM
jgi:hypothetical protein